MEKAEMEEGGEMQLMGKVPSMASYEKGQSGRSREASRGCPLLAREAGQCLCQAASVDMGSSPIFSVLL